MEEVNVALDTKTNRPEPDALDSYRPDKDSVFLAEQERLSVDPHVAKRMILSTSLYLMRN